MAIGRILLVALAMGVLAVGAASVLYLRGGLNPNKIKVVDVAIPNSKTYQTTGLFNPRNITVVIGVNNTVRWTDYDPNYAAGARGFSPHTVTEGKPVPEPPTVTSCTVPVKGTTSSPFQCPATTPLFDSGDIQQNGTFTYTFTHPGVYEYFCVYHPYMIGFVIVKQS